MEITLDGVSLVLPAARELRWDGVPFVCVPADRSREAAPRSREGGWDGSGRPEGPDVPPHLRRPSRAARLAGPGRPVDGPGDAVALAALLQVERAVQGGARVRAALGECAGEDPALPDPIDLEAPTRGVGHGAEGAEGAVDAHVPEGPSHGTGRVVPGDGHARDAERPGRGALPHVTTRQWVVTVPWKRRWLLARRPELADDGNVVVGLKRVWSDGTLALVFSASELVERLVALVPPPLAKRLTRHPRMRLAGERPSWSVLLARVFRVDGFARPGCGGPLTLRCAAWS